MVPLSFSYTVDEYVVFNANSTLRFEVVQMSFKVVDVRSSKRFRRVLLCTKPRKETSNQRSYSLIHQGILLEFPPTK